jgi:hypothetical protein
MSNTTADADANARAAYAKKLLEIDRAISNNTLDAIAKEGITSHRQLYQFATVLFFESPHQP